MILSNITKTLKRIMQPKIIGKKKVRESMQVVRLYAFLLFLFPVIFILAFLFNGWQSRHFDLSAITTFFGTFIAGFATIRIVSHYLVDKNHDGRPDASEEEETDSPIVRSDINAGNRR